MNISLPSMLSASLDSFRLQDRITLTTQQMAIAKIALVILTALATVYCVLWLLNAPPRVTVIESDGSQHPSPLDQVNGNVKVVFDSFLGSGATVEGEFTDGKLNGPGKEIFPYGSVKEMEGEYKNGRLEGQGTITYRNGTIVEGEFKSDYYQIDTLHGRGKITYADGKIEEGEFRYSHLNGQGKRTYPNGKVEEGTFKNGKLSASHSFSGNGAITEEEFKEGHLPDSFETKASQKYLKHILNQ